MKGRNLLVGIVIAGAIGSVGLKKMDPPLIPIARSVEAYLVPENLTPPHPYVIPSPPGVTTKTYNVPMCFSDVLEAMDAQPGWRQYDSSPYSYVGQKVFVPKGASPYSRVEITPGRLVTFNLMAARRGGALYLPSPNGGKGYTVVTVVEGRVETVVFQESVPAA